jgi:hypothetical protein
MGSDRAVVNALPPDAFLEAARRHADGSPLPEFVEQEFRDVLTCGVLPHGFARLRCC